MKKFAFTLERVLDYKNQILKTEKARLAALNAELNRLNLEKQSILDLITSANVKGRGVAGETILAAGLLANRNYIDGLRSNVMTVNSQVIAQQNFMERQLRQVIALQREIASMEMLRDKQRKEYDVKLLKEEELFIEEFINQRTQRLTNQGL